jgi:hypothetical protein
MEFCPRLSQDVLDPAARAALLNALMVSDTLRTHPRGAEWAKNIFLNTHSMELVCTGPVSLYVRKSNPKSSMPMKRKSRY